MPHQYDDSYIFIRTFSQFVVALLHLEGSLLKLLSVSEMLAEKEKKVLVICHLHIKIF
jgi:hypothetical protein